MFEFAPDVGIYASRLTRLAAGIAADKQSALRNLADELNAELTAPDLSSKTDPSYARLLYSWSLLLDVHRIGGQIWVRDSRILISWPDWEGREGREVARRALEGAVDLRPLTTTEIERVRPMFFGDSDGATVARLLAEGRFWLESTDTSHPSGLKYAEAFTAALRLWTMPYRGRQGRQKRFVLLCEHPKLAPRPVVAGIIEMGDEAPFCTWRDNLLVLNLTSLEAWLEREGDVVSWAALAESRFREFRAGLQPTQLIYNLSTLPALEILRRAKTFEDKSAGRSTTGTDFEARKRLAYALRLAHGEHAMSLLKAGADPAAPEVRRHLSAGVRALHDLVLPRLHMEACVCGPVPPFSYGLGGKLVVAFLAHPSIIALPAQAKGTVLEQSFDLDRIGSLLPRDGMLALTTKGLYARHAPMYHRAAVPGVAGPLALRHFTNTEGATTTLLSDRTARLARRVLETSADQGRLQVSRIYGSGGAKRHRTFEVAARVMGFSPEIVSAGIRRPVYALEFASNIGSAVWKGDAINWRIQAGLSGESYERAAVELWRRKWLQKATQRLHEYAFLPSPLRIMEVSPLEFTSTD